MSTEQRARIPELLAELRRRRVVRAVAMYAVAGWVVIQVSATTFPYLGLPGWTVTAVIVAAALGLPLVVLLSWLFDLKPTASERTDSSEAAATPAGGRRSRSAGGDRLAAGFAVAGVLVAGLAVTAAGSHIRRAAADDGVRITVRPFDNLTGRAALDPLGAAAADWIVQGLGEVGLVQVAEVRGGGGVERPDRSGARAGRGDILVLGSFVVERDSLVFQARLARAADGKVVRSVPATAAPQDLPTAALDVVRRRIAAALVSLLEPGHAFESAILQPPTYEAYQAYVQGLEAFLQRFDFVGAAGHSGARSISTAPSSAHCSGRTTARSPPGC